MLHSVRAENERLHAEIAELKKATPGASPNKSPLEREVADLKAAIQSLTVSQSQLTAKLERGISGGGPVDAASFDRSALELQLEATFAELVAEGNELPLDKAGAARDVFDVYSGSSGTIDEEQARQVLKYLGSVPTEQDLETQLSEADNGDGELNLSEFLMLYARVLNTVGSTGTDEDDEVDADPDESVSIGTMSEYGVYALMRWVKHDKDEIAGDVIGPLVPKYRRVARAIVLRKDAELVFYLCILLSAISDGLVTYPEIADNPLVFTFSTLTISMYPLRLPGIDTAMCLDVHPYSTDTSDTPTDCWTCDMLTERQRRFLKPRTCRYFFEVVLKVIAECQSAKSAADFFTDGWNTFDVVILTGLTALAPIAAMTDADLALRCMRVLRLIRALRIARAAKVAPGTAKPQRLFCTFLLPASLMLFLLCVFAHAGLSLVLESTLSSIISVAYIILFMFLSTYLFAIVGVTLFRGNDPFHFGSLGATMLTLFRIATLEDWCDVMYTAIYGCALWAPDVPPGIADDCSNEAFNNTAIAYFVLYGTCRPSPQYHVSCMLTVWCYVWCSDDHMHDPLKSVHWRYCQRHDGDQAGELEKENRCSGVGPSHTLKSQNG